MFSAGSGSCKAAGGVAAVRPGLTLKPISRRSAAKVVLLSSRSQPPTAGPQWLYQPVPLASCDRRLCSACTAAVGVLHRVWRL